jgi:hypothetical protein
MNREQLKENVYVGEILDNLIASKSRCQRKCDDSIMNKAFSSKEDCLVSCTDGDLMGWFQLRKFWFDMSQARN